MPERNLVARELADVLGVIAHPVRVRIIEELGQGDKDVSELVSLTDLPQPTVSQHLAALRSRRLVDPKRTGRSVSYSLAVPWLADWLLHGLKLVDRERITNSQLARAATKARRIWGQRKAESKATT